MSRRTIVSVVEDDPAMRAALIDLLESAGCQTLSFDSGEAFIASQEASASDVLITDIQLGKLDGLSLLKRVRESRQPLPVIIITALTDERLARSAAAQGCYAFLRKPFNPDTLLGHVRAAAAA